MSRESLWTALALVLLLAAAALVRAPGILDGLPFIYDPDEFNRFNRVLGMIAEYRLNPEWFGHPASTVIYPMWALFAGVYLVGRTLHWYANVPGFIELVAQDPSLLVAGARALMLGYSLALVCAVFLLGRIFGRTAGISAAAVTAVSPLLVANGTLIRSSDIVMVLFAALAVLYALRILDGARARHYALAGAFVGLAATSKYPGVLSFLAVIAAHLLAFGFKPRSLRLLVLAGASAAAAAFLSAPYLFLDWQTTLADLAQEGRTTEIGGTGAGFLGDLTQILTELARSGIGIAGAVLTGLGLAWVLARRPREGLVLLAFPVVLLLFLSSLPLRWSRWAIPLIPFAAVLIGLAVQALARMIRGWCPPVMRYSPGPALALLVVIPLVSGSLAIAQHRALPDTRDAARAWILEHLPQGSGLFVEARGPQLPRGRYRFVAAPRGELTDYSMSSPLHGFEFPYGVLAKMEPAGLLEQLREKGIRYLVLTGVSGQFEASTGAAKASPGRAGGLSRGRSPRGG